MTTTDSGLRIEYFKDNLYGRVYAVPSAHPHLDWTAAGGYPYLGYLIRFGRWTIYHAGDCVLYPELAAHLRPFNVNVALLPIGPGNFSVSEAAQLASDIGAAWVIPMHHATFIDDARTTEPDAASFDHRDQIIRARAGPVRPHSIPLFLFHDRSITIPAQLALPSRDSDGAVTEMLATGRAGRLRGFLERVRLVGSFPAEGVFGPAEMAECGGLAVDRST